jgi:hypothetical protein
MTQIEQKQIVIDLTSSIQDSMIKKINEGKVPENWDGFEIRHWLCKIADFKNIWTDRIRNRPWRKRIKDCNNTLIVNNLY